MADIEGLGFDPTAQSAGDLLRGAENLAPGPMLLSLLLMVDRSDLCADDAVLFLQLHDRVSSWWASLQADALVAATGPSEVVSEFIALDPRPDRDDERAIQIRDAAREEVAAALRWSPARAQRSMDHARLLAGPLAQTREALERGDISMVHAMTICEAAERMSSRDDSQDQFEADCTALQLRVLPVARRSTLSRTKTCARRAVESIDAAGQARRRQRARCTRDVQLKPEDDGLVTLMARLDATTGHAIFGAVLAGVAKVDIPGECSATSGERRAEVLAALILGAHGAGDHDQEAEEATARSVAVTVDVNLGVTLDVLIAENSLAGLSRQTAQAGIGGLPIEFDDVRRLLGDPAVASHLRPVIVEERGHILDLGRRSYELSAALRRFIVARDGTCRFPGCARAAIHCQIDHADAWEDGGSSDVANLGALCVRHHQLKTHGGWQITESHRDGTCTWRSPMGRIYRHYPQPSHRPIMTPHHAGGEPAAVAFGMPIRDPSPPPF